MIHLERFTENDFATLINWVKTKEELLQFAGPQLDFPLTNEQLQETLQNNKVFAFKIIRNDEELTIGHAEIFVKEESFLLARILIGDKNQRGKGLGKIIVKNLLKYGFENFNKNFAELNVFDWNTSAIKCYEKVGFQINPDLKFERKINGEAWTAINMRIKRSDWERLSKTILR